MREFQLAATVLGTCLVELKFFTANVVCADPEDQKLGQWLDPGHLGWESEGGAHVLKHSKLRK